MIRVLIGLILGVTLSLVSFGFIAVGHGTYVPMALSGSLVAFVTALGAIVPLLLVPLLWTMYFYFIPKIGRRSRRLRLTKLLLILHAASGLWVAKDDPSFIRALENEAGQFLAFIVFLFAAMASLMYFASRGIEPANRDAARPTHESES
jgi:hypothetical protein